MVDQDAANHLRRDAEKMSPVLPFHVTLIHQPDKSLVNQCGALERVIRPFLAEITTRETPQLAIYQGRKLFQRIFIAVAPIP